MLETISSMLLAVGVGVLGACLLAKGFFQDFWIFTFCFVMASCQYSLLKVRNIVSVLGQLSSSFSMCEIELHSLVYKINRKMITAGAFQLSLSHFRVFNQTQHHQCT